MEQTRQLEIIHLSDIHFGKNHRFIPSITPSGDLPEDSSYPTLSSKLIEDLKEIDPDSKVIVCISGDLTEEGSYDELQQAKTFILDIVKAEVFNKSFGIHDFFIVPGNHDILYDKPQKKERWHQWSHFYNQLYGMQIEDNDPYGYVEIHDRIDEFGFIVLCLNSSIFVEKDKIDQDRGRLDIRQLSLIEEKLDKFDSKKLHSSIKIALIHHHPILIPNLVEPNRGYDAVINSGQLMAILKKYGFHMVLHGHKHNPHTFTEDITSACQNVPCNPIYIVSGGSTGSKKLPNLPSIANCYNQISIKFHPNGGQFRIKIRNRALEIFNDDNSSRLPTKWKWKTIKSEDRSFYTGNTFPLALLENIDVLDIKNFCTYEEMRIAEYKKTRGNFPVVKVMPSLVSNQAYEARLWIEHHPYMSENKKICLPNEVVWIAGKNFPVLSIKRKDDPKFCAIYNYWGPMLVQAILIFPDGKTETVSIYARIPKHYNPTIPCRE